MDTEDIIKSLEENIEGQIKLLNKLVGKDEYALWNETKVHAMITGLHEKSHSIM